MTDQPTGRALAEAAARAMGWRQGANCWLDGWTQRDLEKSPPTEREMMARLHERGELETYTNAKEASAALWYPNIDDGAGGCKVGGTSPTAHGATLREALMRLVVAVAEREATNG